MNREALKVVGTMWLGIAAICAAIGGYVGICILADKYIGAWVPVVLTFGLMIYMVSAVVYYSEKARNERDSG